MAEALRFSSILLTPFMPNTPAKVWAQLGLTELSHLHTWDSLEYGKIPAGTKIDRGEPIFPRLELPKDDSEGEETSKKEAAKAAKKPRKKQKRQPKKPKKRRKTVPNRKSPLTILPRWNFGSLRSSKRKKWRTPINYSNSVSKWGKMNALW